MFRAFVAALAFVSTAFVTAGHSQERVTFDSTDGDLRGGSPTRLTGLLYKPVGVGPFPAVVGLPGCNGLFDEGGKVHPLYGTWGDVLSSEGYSFLLLDPMGSRGHGDLCAVQPASSRPVQPGREMPRDAFGALNYLRARADVQANNIALFGQSLGAAATLFTLADDLVPQVNALDADFRTAIVLYPACQTFLTRKPKWSPRQSFLLLMGDADDFTPPGPCKALVEEVERAQSIALIVVSLRVPIMPSIIQILPYAHLRT